MRSRTVIVLTTAAAAVALAGCGSSSVDAANGTGNTAGAAATARSTSAVPARTRNAIRALQTATRSVPGGRAYDLEPDRHRGQRVWEVKVAVGKQRPHELKISNNGRRVVHRSRHKRDGDATKALRAKISLARAVQTADRRAAGRLSEAEIDRYRGKLVWEVIFDQRARQLEHEVIVNATTGKIIRVKTEKDD